MAINVDKLLEATHATLQLPETNVFDRDQFIEEWIPQAVNEIQELRTRVLLLETQVTDLENQVAELEG